MPASMKQAMAMADRIHIVLLYFIYPSDFLSPRRYSQEIVRVCREQLPSQSVNPLIIFRFYWENFRTTCVYEKRSINYCLHEGKKVQ